MGIPGFNTWFKQKHERSYVSLGSTQVDHLYIDLNSLLHNAIRQGKGWGKFHKILHSKLNELLEVTNPRKTVLLAVDGPAPLAKLITQRNRRKNRGGSGKSDDGNSSVEGLSSNVITPGTRFMADVTLSLTVWVTQKLMSRKWRHLQFELSDGTVMGEGEIKILGRLARPWADLHPADTHVIVGDDSDLILMACVSPWQSNMYVVNAAMTEDKRATRNMKVFSVQALHQLWLDANLHASHTELPVDDTAKLNSMKLDLAMLAILCSGNDYLPGLSGVALPATWQLYRARRCRAQHVGEAICSIDPTTAEPTINLTNLVALLKVVAGVKGGQETAAGNGNGNGKPSAAAASKQQAAGQEADQEEEEEEQEEEEEDVSQSASSQPHGDAELYIKGLLWTLTMYTQGRCSDYRFTFDLHKAPGKMELIKWLSDKAVETPVLSLAHWGKAPAEAQVPLVPLGCALALLPPGSAGLLPAAAQHLMSTSSPLGELYQTCDTCDQLKAAARIAVSQRAQAAAVLAKLQETYDEAVQAEAPFLEQLARDVEQATATFNQRFEANRAAARAVGHHLATMHAPKPFPLESVVKAVEGIDVQAVPPEEQRLLKFGQPVVIGARADFMPNVACMAVKDEGGAQAATLIPDKQLAPCLPDHYLTAPAELDLIPVGRSRSIPPADNWRASGPAAGGRGGGRGAGRAGQSRARGDGLQDRSGGDRWQLQDGWYTGPAPSGGRGGQLPRSGEGGRGGGFVQGGRGAGRGKRPASSPPEQSTATTTTTAHGVPVQPPPRPGTSAYMGRAVGSSSSNSSSSSVPVSMMYQQQQPPAMPMPPPMPSNMMLSAAGQRGGRPGWSGPVAPPGPPAYHTFLTTGPPPLTAPGRGPTRSPPVQPINQQSHAPPRQQHLRWP